jgi:ribosomal protein S18 acetylase RimI-like enzyme
MRFERVSLDNAELFKKLIELDHRAFPWMWWNSDMEFRNYIEAPGVAIDIACDGHSRAMAYVGTTRYRTWGHLDRIAVDPDAQGQGLGRVALERAIASLAAAGARRIGLSTQARNMRSRALYESVGFRRATSHDYRIYGRWLGERVPAGEGV